MKKKLFFIFFILVFSLFFALPAIGITLDKNSYESLDEPIIITYCDNPDSFYEVYDLKDLNTAIEYAGGCIEGNTINFYPNFPIWGHRYTLLGFEIGSLCETPFNLNFYDCKALDEYIDGSDFTFFYGNPKKIEKIVNITNTSSTDLFASAGTLFTDLWVIIAVAIGVPLAFYIFNRVIAINR
jgi:hypothetical protein